MSGIRLVISQEIRDKAVASAMEAAIRTNGGRKLGTGTVMLINAAVEAAIDELEYDLK